MCAVGAAVLLTHNHAASDNAGRSARLAEPYPHRSVGCDRRLGRWLELRLPPGRPSRIAGRVWPLLLARSGTDPAELSRDLTV